MDIYAIIVVVYLVKAFLVMTVVAKMLDILLPPRCFACGDDVQDHGSQCAACWSKVDFISHPLCSCCGVPFDYVSNQADEEEGFICGDCAKSAHAYDQARAVFVYDDHSKKMILSFKHGDRHEGVPAFAIWLWGAAKIWEDEIDIIMPVPLHWRRLFKRRFNQAAEMAYAVGKLAGLGVNATSLKRHKPTRSQFGLGARQRQKNVQSAFSINDKDKAAVKGKTILLVDDVMTTGATINACAKALKKVGAKKVYAVSLARVVNSS